MKVKISCENCGHVEGSHHRNEPRKCKNRSCKCQAFTEKPDIERFNTTDGKPPIELYDFQKSYLDRLPPKYIFAADTGTGKTFMALAHYDKHAYLKPLLILAPAPKITTGDWDDHIKQYFAGRLVPEYEIYSYEKFSRIPSVKQYAKTGDRGVWRDYLQRHPNGFALIADEVHKGKNPQSGNGKRLFEVASAADFFVGLSATPLPNGWIDGVNYFKIFGFTKGITAFKQRYCRIVDFKGFPEIVEYYRQGELKKFWNSIAKPLAKQSALDLPPVTHVPISLPAGPEYIKIQKERLFNDEFLDNPSALLHAMRQSLLQPKLQWVDNFLDGTSDNTVIFYNYRGERDALLALLKKKYGKRTVFRHDGEQHVAPNREDWDSLDRTVTLAQYQSGSTGLEFTYASTIVYFSPTYSYSNFEQSIGRINRHGQRKKMTLYLLCAPTTVERDIWGALKNKENFQERQWLLDKLESEGAK